MISKHEQERNRQRSGVKEPTRGLSVEPETLLEIRRRGRACDKPWPGVKEPTRGVITEVRIGSLPAGLRREMARAGRDLEVRTRTQLVVPKCARASAGRLPCSVSVSPSRRGLHRWNDGELAPHSPKDAALPAPAQVPLDRRVAPGKLFRALQSTSLDGSAPLESGRGFIGKPRADFRSGLAVSSG